MLWEHSERVSLGSFFLVQFKLLLHPDRNPLHFVLTCLIFYDIIESEVIHQEDTSVYGQTLLLSLYVISIYHYIWYLFYNDKALYFLVLVHEGRMTRISVKERGIV